MKKRGFTLIEMLIVIIIIGILAATLIPRIGNARNRATDTAKVADIKSIATALVAYSLENPEYPEVLCSGDTTIESVLLNSKYGLGGSMPVNPDYSDKTGSGRCYDYRKIGTDHFVLCAQLSSTDSGNGNATGSLITDNDLKNLGYDAALEALDHTNGEYHCFVG